MDGLLIKTIQSNTKTKIVNIIVNGGLNQFKAKVEFDETWNMLNKSIVFDNGEIVKHILLDSNNECIIPDIIINNVSSFKFSILGVLEENTIYTTNKTVIPVYQGSKNDTGELPEPNIFQQYIKEMDLTLAESKEILEQIEVIKDSAIKEATNIISNGLTDIETISSNNIKDVDAIKKQIEDSNQNTIAKVEKVYSNMIKDATDIINNITQKEIDITNLLNKLTTESLNSISKLSTSSMNDLTSLYNNYIVSINTVGSNNIKELNIIKDNNIEEMNDIKNETEEIKGIALDYISAIPFSTFGVDLETGEMILYNPERLLSTVFKLNYVTGELEVIINE